MQARLRRVDHATGIITTVAGGNTASATPTATGVAADTAAMNSASSPPTRQAASTSATAPPPTATTRRAPAHPTGTVTLLTGTPDPSAGGSLTVEPDAAGDIFLTDSRTITRLDHGTLAPQTIYVFDPTPLEAFPRRIPPPLRDARHHISGRQQRRLRLPPPSRHGSRPGLWRAPSRRRHARARQQHPPLSHHDLGRTPIR